MGYRMVLGIVLLKLDYSAYIPGTTVCRSFPDLLMCFCIWVQLELGVDLNDEGRSDSGEQASLWSESIRAHPNNS